MSVGASAKAIVGGLVAGLTAAGTALLTPGVTTAEWVTIALAALGTGGGVWVTTNQTTGARPITVNVTRPTTSLPPPLPPVPPSNPDPTLRSYLEGSPVSSSRGEPPDLPDAHP